MSECDYSVYPVSVFIVVVDIFSFFDYSSLKPLQGFAPDFVFMLLVCTPIKFVKMVVLPPFFKELWVNLWKFLGIS